MDLDVYGLCLGGNVFGWTADRDASFAVLDAYVEAGGNFIDTADTYMRPNMGISETIIGEWMAARGNRDELVIATKVGSDGGLSAANIAAHVDESLAAAADRPDRPLLRAQGRRVGAGRGDRARVRRAACATARSATSRRPTSRRTGSCESLEIADARRARARTRGCSRTTTSSSARATSATTRRSSAQYGLRVAPYYALAVGLSDRQVPRRARDGDSPRAETALELSRRARRGGAGARWTRSPPRTASRSARSRSPGCSAKPGDRGADRQRAHRPSSSLRSCRGWA